MNPCPDRSAWAAWAADAADVADGIGDLGVLRAHLEACAKCQTTLAACEADERELAARLRLAERTVPPVVSARAADALALRLVLAARGMEAAPTPSVLPETHRHGEAMTTAPASLALDTLDLGHPSKPDQTNGTGRAPTARPDLRAGTSYAELRIEERIESDAFADTYVARAPDVDDAIELLVLDPRVTRDAAIRTALLDGMRVLARFDHPHVQRLRTFGKSKGCYYAAYAYILGEPASERLRGRRPQDYAATIAHLRQLALALEALHAAGSVHGRIGPQTVVLGVDRATLVRPGLPRVPALERAGWTRLAPVYAAPEVLAGGAPDAPADLFALGCLAYHLLAGTAAYRADSMDEAAERVAAGAPGLRKHNQRVPAEAADLIARLIHSDPGQRLADAGELGRALAALPRETPTRVVVDYASALGAAATAAPAKETARSPAPRTEAKPPTDRARSASSRRARPATYQELVAEMNEAAALDEARTATSAHAPRGLAGRAYRRLQSQGLRNLPRGLLSAAASLFLCVGLGTGGFYWWSVTRQSEMNEAIAQAPGRGISPSMQSDPNAGKAPAPTAAEKRERVVQDCNAVYQRVLDGLRKIEVFDSTKDRDRLESLSRQLLEGCIDVGKKKGFEWKYLADAYNLRGRIEFYWVYTDRFCEVSDSVRKDHIGISNRDLETARRLYELPGATTQFRLRANAWMPEYRQSSKFVLAASRADVALGFPEVRVTTARDAADDLAHFRASAGLPIRQP